MFWGINIDPPMVCKYTHGDEYSLYRRRTCHFMLFWVQGKRNFASKIKIETNTEPNKETDNSTISFYIPSIPFRLLVTLEIDDPIKGPKINSTTS